MTDLNVRNVPNTEETIPDHTTEYQIYLKTMSGDADGYVEQNFFFKNKSEFYYTAYLLSHLLSAKIKNKDDDEILSYIVEVAKRINFGKHKNYAVPALNSISYVEFIQSFLFDTVGLDITAKDHFAKIDKIDFYYWTCPTKRERVEIEINDNYYSDFCYFDSIDFGD